MQKKIEQFIESQTNIVNGEQSFTFDSETFDFTVPLSGRHDLPVNGSHTIEGNLDSGDDEIEVTYLLIKFTNGKAEYLFSITG